GLFCTGRNDVPAGAPAADMIKRGEFARNVERLVIGSADSGDQTDALRHGSQSGQLSERLKLVRAAACIAVRNEQRIEQAAFGDLRQLLIVANIQSALRLGGWVPPGGLMVAGGGNKSVNVQLAIQIGHYHI